MTQEDVTYGAVQIVEEIGRLAQAHRKHRRPTLATVSGLGNLSTRFLSEFERRKETAETGKVLKALGTLRLEIIIQPRGRLVAGSPSRQNPPEIRVSDPAPRDEQPMKRRSRN